MSSMQRTIGRNIAKENGLLKSKKRENRIYVKSKERLAQEMRRQNKIERLKREANSRNQNVKGVEKKHRLLIRIWTEIKKIISIFKRKGE